MSKEQTLMKQYRFDFDNGVTRFSQELTDTGLVRNAGVELIAEMAREDPECTVTVVGFSA